MKFVLFFIACLPLLGFQDRDGREIRLVFANSAQDIDLGRSREILVASFMKGYEDVPLTELNPNFKSIGDVRRFYEDYFVSELDHFKNGHLFWVQAFDGEELLGWATFELEKSERDAAYMNLLTVDPAHQKRGVGKHLVFSICSELPNIHAINVLVRKVNVQGEQFYRQIGFTSFDYPRDDNFVDPNLLSGFRWALPNNF